MNLITEIINNLSSDNPNLTAALTKTKVLLHKLDQKELAESWVNKELNGYDKGDELPGYRILSVEPRCNVMNAAWHAENQPLALGNNLTEEERDSIRNYRMRDSISSIEHNLVELKGGRFAAFLPAESYHKLSEIFTNNGQITSAWVEITVGSLVGLRTEVQSRLLDFVLNLQDEFGEQVTNEEIEQQAREVDTRSMFNNAILDGQNITINLGNNNAQNVTNLNINAGDKEELFNVLRSLDIAEEDLNRLNDCIEKDGDIQNKKIGENVTGWCKNMYQRIIEGAWTIEMHTAATVITNALQKFYGI